MVSIMTKNNPTKIYCRAWKARNIIEREFDAPRELCLAFTDPKLYAQWLGPRGLTMKLERLSQERRFMAVHFKKIKPGNEYAFHGRES